MPPLSTQEILKKYGAKIEEQIDTSSTPQNYSQEYMQFKKDMVPEIGKYEKWCNSLGNLLKLKVSDKDKIKVQKYLDIGHLDVTPSQVITLSIFSMLIVFFATLIISVAIFLNEKPFPILFAFLGVIASMFIFYYTYSMPQRLANSWRLRASAQMVPAALYVVVYMKHTSNLERAISFAADHLEGPLALDFKKIFYDVEVSKYSTIKQSLDTYLETWRDYAPEFIESFHLIESSLFEPSEARRIQILEKALQTILEGIYEKMLKYSREIRSPLTNVYMLGIILPTLGLALLPLASTLLQGFLQWQHVFVMFNIIIPFFVFYMVSEILLKRPGGYGETSVLELNPDYYKFKSRKPWITAAIIALPILIIGFMPFILQIDYLSYNVANLTDTQAILGLKSDYTFGELGLPFFEKEIIFDFKCTDPSDTLPCTKKGSSKVGPFGTGGILLSLLIPLSIALFFSIAYKKKTKDLIKARKDTKFLEEEFTNSLFILGNRLGDGIPAEIAIGKVAEATQGQQTQQFFYLINQNVQQQGMSVEKAIFDKRRGAIIYFPSSLIATSMKILVESVKKGLQVAARSLMSISEYVKNIEKINQRLRDLLAEIVSDMKSNMTFLAPLLAGIVVGLTAMITSILSRLQVLVVQGTGSQEIGGLGSITNIVDIFDVTKMIPPFFIQLVIGIYLIEIIFILTSALVTVDSGKDPLKEKNDLYKNLRAGMILYLITSLVSIISLSFLANVALGGLAG